jgi:hypothetical protein
MTRAKSGWAAVAAAVVRATAAPAVKRHQWAPHADGMAGGTCKRCGLVKVFGIRVSPGKASTVAAYSASGTAPWAFEMPACLAAKDPS